MKKEFQLRDLKWGTIKRYDGIEGNSVGLTFDSYVVFYKDKNGMYVNAVSQEEKYFPLEKLRPFTKDSLKSITEGTYFIETISDRADFILYRAFNLNRKDTFSVKDIEDAILESDTFYFKDAERIKKEREDSFVKQKIKKIMY